MRLDPSNTELLAQKHFNPRIPAGCDLILDPKLTAAGWNFNPRIPAGCDSFDDHGLVPPDHFNPRIPAGCDDGYTKSVSYSKEFQSTHPCGMRLAWHAGDGANGPDFNPRIPAGCDLTSARHPPPWSSFQSTHPCGMRRSTPTILPSHTWMISIHASLRDAT